VDIDHRREVRSMRRSASTPIPVATTDSVALLVRMAAVVQITGLARSTIYKLMAADKFPTPVQLTGRAVAWRRADLERWSAARPNVTHCPNEDHSLH
jgi:prophage regulatory protein